MKIKLRINGKMLLYFLGTTILVYIFALGYISYKLRNISSENAQNNLNAVTVELSNNAKRKLDTYMSAATTVAYTFSNFEDFPEENRRDFFAEMLKDLLEKNDDFLATWSIWESNSIDNLDNTYKNKPGSTVLGNFRHVYYRKNDSIVLSNIVEQDSSAVFSGKVYTRIKETLAEQIVEPYYYSYTQKEEDKILQTNMVAPIIKNGKFLGVVGIDAPMSHIQKEFSELKPIKDSIKEAGNVFIITNNGEFLSNPDSTFLGKLFTEFAPEMEAEFNILNGIRNGKLISTFATDPISNKTSLFLFRPLFIGNSKTPWSFCVSVPSEILFESANYTFKKTLLVGSLGLLIVSLVIALIAMSISKPLVKTTKNLRKISKGNIENIDKTNFVIKDEIGDMADAMTDLVNGLKSAAKFAHEIGNGNLDAKYTLLSDKDVLGNSLLSMQKSLAIAKKEEEKKRIEDEKRNWVTHGLATFGEIIRQHNDNMEKFSLNVVTNLVDYTNAAQIAIYINQKIENDFEEDDSFELKAAMAYGKQVMLNKTFATGEEMLGRAVTEEKTIYIENIPERYVALSPGMQDKKRPQFLLITPISINNNTLGVFELLFYNSIEPHYIDFIEKLSENIASVISSVKTNIRTAKLLEQSQHQADELAQHEEEMRQNLEEMQATQEEASKRQNSLNSHLKAIKGSLMMAELDTKSRIIEMTASMRVVYSGNIENIRGMNFGSLVTSDINEKNEFSDFWDTLIASGSAKRMQLIKQRNKELMMLESYKVITKEGMTPKVVVIAIDKTEEKELNNKLNEALK